eukprot:960228-Alexandrium_andersonii.AAC.1
MGTTGPDPWGYLDDPIGPGDRPARGDLPGDPPTGPSPVPHGLRVRHRTPRGPRRLGPAQEIRLVHRGL